MQLIDQNHLLAVGKNTPNGWSGPTQVSLFDIGDLQQPEQIAQYTFEKFSTSEAEVDHHAFGYYSEFGLLAMPVSIAHTVRVDLDGDGYAETSRVDNDFELAVFSIDVNAANPADRLTLKTEIEHDDTVRRSGFIGDKLYSIANGSIKVVNIADPDNVVAQLTIPPSENPPFSVIHPDYFLLNPVLSLGLLQTPYSDSPPPEDPLTIAIDHSREAFAAENETATGDALLVTAEASPKDGGGFSVVLEAHGQNYLYHIDTDGVAQLVDANFHFSESIGAWHAIEARPALSHHHSASKTTSGVALATATSLSLGGDGYFTSSGANPIARTHRSIQGGTAGETNYDAAALSLLALSSLHPNAKLDDNGLLDRLQHRVHGEDSSLDLSDLDDAFDALDHVQLGRRPAIGQSHRR
jgi:hypothetical protein